MELQPKEQILDLIEKSNKILVITHTNPDGDALGSLLALYLALAKLGKKVTAVCSDPAPASFGFLPQLEAIQAEFSGSQDFIIVLDVSETKPEKLSYNLQDKKLNIIITPKRGQFKKEDVSFSYGDYRYDLIIVLDCQDLERIGVLYEQNIQMFYETPIANIDHHAGNEYFGQVNLVELTATSTCEILYSIIEELGENLIDEDVATALLCGIITDTGSFQNSNTTPKSLTLAAQLVALGGRQQEIIQYVYKTKSVSTLKLWGKALQDIKYDLESKFAWTKVSLKDLEETGARPEETSGLIDELLSSVPEAQLVLLLSEKKKGQIFGSLRSKKEVDASLAASLFGGGGHPEAAGFTVEGNLEEKEKEIVSKIKDYLLGKTKEEKKESLSEIKKLSAKIEADQSPAKLPTPDPKSPAPKTPPIEETVPSSPSETKPQKDDQKLEQSEFEKWIKKIRNDT